MDFVKLKETDYNTMNINEALLKRKSVRAFLDKKVDDSLIFEILNCARYTPSGTNTQPWEVAVVRGHTKSLLDEQLTHAFKSNTPQHPDYNYYPKEFNADFKRRRIECGLALYSTLGITRENKELRLKQWAQNYTAFGAPVVLYIFTDKLIDKGSFMDCGMFIQSIMLMAEHLGLASCPQAALAEYPDIVRKQLNYPQDKLLLCGIAIGYEDTDAIINNYRTSREDVNTFTRFFD